MADKTEVVIRHEVVNVSSSGARAESGESSQILKGIESLIKSLKPVVKQASNISSLARDLKAAKSGGEKTVIGRPESNRVAMNRVQRSLLAYDRLVNDAPIIKPSAKLKKQFESFRDLDKTQKTLFNSTGAVNKSLKDSIKLFAREVSSRRTVQELQKRAIRREALLQRGVLGASGGLSSAIVMKALGYGLLTAGGRVLQQTAGVEAAYRATLPLTRASETGQLMISTQNQVRKGLADGITAALVVGGAAVGGPLGAALGGIIGTIYSAHVAAANAATMKSYQLGRAGASAYLTAEPVNARMVSTHIRGSRYPINLPSNLNQEYNQSGLVFMKPFLETNPSFRRMGLNLQPTNPLIKHLAYLRSTGVNTRALANPIAFLTAIERSRKGGIATRGDSFVSSLLGVSGSDVLDKITGLSRKTGIAPAQLGQMMSSILQTTGISTVKGAGNFITATTPFGGGFQRAALQYQQAGPIEKFRRNLMMKALFPNVDATKLFGGTSSQIAHQRISLKKDVHDMNQRSGDIPIGSILAEKALQGGQNFHEVMNAPTPSAQSQARSSEEVPATDWKKLIGPAIKEALSSVQDMKVNRLIVDSKSPLAAINPFAAF